MRELQIVESKKIIKIARWFSKSHIIGTQFMYWLFAEDVQHWEDHRDNDTIYWRHENIHFIQQKELFFVGFWFLYVLNYLINLFRFKFEKRKAYKRIAFEQEAYYNDGNTRYLSSRKKFNWTKWIT